MSTNHEAVAALPAASSPVKQLVRDMAVRRFPYVLTAAANALDLVAVDPASGAAIIDLMANGRVYHYDSTDTTTAHDGTTVLVSVEGRRYKLAAGTDVVVYAVLDNTLTAPPGSPATGDAYLVAVGGTGAWSGHDGAVAVYTARGWEFITVAVGRLVYVAGGTNVDTFYHKDSGGSWVAGIGAQSFTASSVPISAIINGARLFIVENQTTTSPPASPTLGVAYIVGASATGAWAGKDGQLAVCEVTGAWSYYAPAAGYQAYDNNLSIYLRYTGSAWVSISGAIIGAAATALTTSGSTSTGGSGGYTYSATTAPTTSQVYVEDSVTLAYTARRASARLRFNYTVHMGSNLSCTVGLFRDSEANAVAWANVGPAGVAVGTVHVPLEIAANNDSAHTYKIRLINNGAGAPSASITRRLLNVEEFA